MTDRRESPTIRTAAAFLGVIGLVCALAITFLAYQRRDVPQALAVGFGTAIGGLATLLTTFTPAPLIGGRRATDPMPEPGEDSGVLGPVGTTK